MPAITGARGGHPRRSLSIGELARASGVGVETIRFWERAGLLPAPPRSPSGRRLFGPEAVERLRFVRHARALGFPLEEVRTVLAMASGEAGGCEEVRALAERHLLVLAVRARIARLERMEAALEATLARCARGELSCPLLAALAEPEGPLDELPAEPGVAGGPA